MNDFLNVFTIVYMWPAIAMTALGTAAYFTRRYILATERRIEDRLVLLTERVQSSL